MTDALWEWPGKKTADVPLLATRSRPASGLERVEPFEFTSNGGGGAALSLRAKRREATSFEVNMVCRDNRKAREESRYVSAFFFLNIQYLEFSP
jgi:hypothetical protein